MVQMELQSGSHISLTSCTIDGVKTWCHMDWNMHGNYLQMRLCIVKPGVDIWLFLGGDGVEMHVRTIFP